MKMLFKVGKLREKNNQEAEIQFIPTDTATELAFTDSIDKVAGLFPAYDLGLYGTVNKKEIFYLFDMRKGHREVYEELINIMVGHDINVLNRENALIYENVYNDIYDFVDNETVFWDVRNHLIIVIGKESLKALVTQIEKYRWAKWLGADSESFAKIISDEGLSLVYRKVNRMISTTGNN